MVSMGEKRRTSGRTSGRRAGASPRYSPPETVARFSLRQMLIEFGRSPLSQNQMKLLDSRERDIEIFICGDRLLNNLPTVSIVGTRDVSEPGRQRAARLARELAASHVVVMSGLARGVDTAALEAAAAAGGHVAAVIGTPVDKAYPAENAGLQEIIYRDHLLVSPFAIGTQTFRGNFPRRNRVMAALSDATVIVEASDTSGTLHQAAECHRLGRWLFIMKSVVDDKSLSWPTSFLRGEKTMVLESTVQLVNAVTASRS